MFGIKNCASSGASSKCNSTDCLIKLNPITRSVLTYKFSPTAYLNTGIIESTEYFLAS